MSSFWSDRVIFVAQLSGTTVSSTQNARVGGGCRVGRKVELVLVFGVVVAGVSGWCVVLGAWWALRAGPE
jgi:hypothetical protein